jgi:hypothetical protein
MKKFFAIAALALVSAVVHAETTTVYVSCSNGEHDPVGASFCSALKDKIASSPRYILSNKQSDFHFDISIVTVSFDANSTAASIVFGYNNPNGPLEFFTHLVQTCGINRVSLCADDIYSEMDKKVFELNNHK